MNLVRAGKLAKNNEICSDGELGNQNRCESESSEPNILVVLHPLSESYLISGDGKTISDVEISAERKSPTEFTRHALLKDKLHIFGGTYVGGQMVSRLDDCSFVDIHMLRNSFYGEHSVLSIFQGNEALICFGNYGGNVCEVFTGSSNHGIYPSTYSHTFSGLAYYNGLPTTVGGGYPEANRKVETLSVSGWTTLPDHPKAINGHNLIGLTNGDLLTIGGQDRDVFISEIWRLSDNVWSLAGNLQNVNEPIF